MDRLGCTQKITCPETSGNQLTLDRVVLAFFSNLTLPNCDFGVDFDGNGGGKDDNNNNEYGRDIDASDEGDGGKNGSRAWQRRRWRQKMQGSVAGWCCLASGILSYLL